MTHAEKVETYKKLMASRGVASTTAVPPAWEIAWSLGVPLPPPLFLSPLAMSLFTGIWFGVLFGAFAFLLGNRGHRSMSLHEASLVALSAGTLFGLAMAWFGRRLARKHALGPWSAFGATRVRT